MQYNIYREIQKGYISYFNYTTIKEVECIELIDVYFKLRRTGALSTSTKVRPNFS